MPRRPEPPKDRVEPTTLSVSAIIDFPRSARPTRPLLFRN